MKFKSNPDDARWFYPHADHDRYICDPATFLMLFFSICPENLVQGNAMSASRCWDEGDLRWAHVGNETSFCQLNKDLFAHDTWSASDWSASDWVPKNSIG